ncbi:hypothetical protein T492DRAFT_838891 [Pavlovales sp. CCMP2436]|nr:hypothetical protein T492DRAFT_838891 [Pavlovales sp. CCMP2436]
MELPHEMTFDNESIEVQFSYSLANPILDGTVCVISDTLALEVEGPVVDLKMSTYTLNMLHPTGAVGTTNYSIRMIKNNASSSMSRDFNWTSLDSPSVVVTKWQTQMRATITSESFGHCVLQFDSVLGKFSAAYDRDLAYGTFTDVFYQVDRDFGGVGDQSKTTLGLLITNSLNLFWQTNMAPRQFPNIAHGVISPVTLLKVMANSERELVIADFVLNDNIQATKAVNASFQDLWIWIWIWSRRTCRIDLQYHVTPVYDPATKNAHSRDSPAFVFKGTIVTNFDLSSSSGWWVDSSTTYLNDPNFAVNKAYDKNTTTHWGSSADTFTSAGVVLQFLSSLSPRNNLHNGMEYTTDYHLIMKNIYGQQLNVIANPVDFEFSILLTKHGRIVNSGMYRLSSTGLVKTS